MRNFITYEWFTVFSLLGLALVAVAKYTNGLRFNDFLSVVGNSTYLKIYAKGQKFIDLFDSFLFVNLVLSLSVFSYFTYSVFEAPLTFELTVILKVLFTITTILLIKILLERLLGSLFEIDTIIDYYLFQKTTFKNYSGLVFLASNLLLLYTKISAEILIIATLIVVSLINLVGFLSTFKEHQKSKNFNFFYFLLYLCALEIGPYVLLYKVFREYNA